VPTGPKNLVYRVARLLQQRYGVHDGVDVKILKRIPVAAGLAGGSSNAATALIGLNRVWKLGLKRQELIAIGNTLGSDIAFFLHDCAWALGEGRGERIIPLKIKAKLWQILVVPKVKMYTPKVYNALDLKKLTKRKDDANILIHSLYKKNINKIHNVLSNDLEYGILLLAPKLEAVLKRMKALGIKGVSFSGSGSSVFGLTDSKQAAETLCVLLKKRYSQVFVVSTC
jgi:4-diphosphocytidyl-2-C-methyl-D-erythritol kinase